MEKSYKKYVDNRFKLDEEFGDEVQNALEQVQIILGNLVQSVLHLQKEMIKVKRENEELRKLYASSKPKTIW